MIDFVPVLKIALIFAVACASPGPDFMMVSSLVLSRGRSAGVQAAFGVAAGVLVWVILCMFGLGFIFAKLQGLMIAVRICGGLYLLYLGYQLWKASFKPQTLAAVKVNVSARKRHHPFYVGFLSDIMNPKSLAFFTSIFAVALPKDANLTTQIVIVAVMGVLPIIWFSLVSFCLSTPAMRKVYMRWSRWIDRVCGTFLAFFGARLLTSFKD